MKIRVKHTYTGWKTNERVIYPGLYDVDDARLFGAANYLVANNHAIVVADPEPVVVPEPEPEPVIEVAPVPEPEAEETQLAEFPPAYPVKSRRPAKKRK